MEEQLISYETAVLAKEKGFGLGLTNIFYNPKGVVCSSKILMTDSNNAYATPTQSLLQKWLRDEHKIHISVTPAESKWIYSTNPDYTDIFKIPTTWWDMKDTFESALESALKESLALI